MSVPGIKCSLVTIILLFNIVIQKILAQYEPPTPTVEPLHPKGLRMSIPDENGISLVAYHVKFNEDFYGLEAGSIARDIIKRKNGRWTYEDRTTRLKRGDKLYYWIHVVYDGLGYNLLDQQYDYEFVVYMNNNDNVEVKDGSLHIRPTFTNDKYGDNYIKNGNLTLEKCTGRSTLDCKRQGTGWNILPPIISGRLNTKSSFTFQYGHIQIRAKFPRGDWLYPLITLESTTEYNETSVLYFDIIVAQSNGNPFLKLQDGSDMSGHVLLGGAHATKIQLPIEDNRVNLPKKTATDLWSDNYHVYDLKWKRGKITLMVDGEQYGEQTVPALHDTPVYINIGLVVGGHTTFPDGSVSNKYSKPWGNVEAKALYNFYSAADKWQPTWTNSDTGLHVDYIKIWAV
ncbi:Beta-1,3-glucan-binding protein [Melipona quadrifasciata]|uniref:Beta-1,3-glucan-binding protein n=1 Tax=Melipona quadrifasciata TaxID=166423 RepID=A0A0N0BDS6_9HYME|nr:Beta-1,3-glucan-binding protein [Melipona quadrifasciata]